MDGWRCGRRRGLLRMDDIDKYIKDWQSCRFYMDEMSDVRLLNIIDQEHSDVGEW